MTWIVILRTALSIINSISSIIQEKQLMDAGEAKATAKSLAEISKRLGVVEQVRAEIAALSDAELDEELGGDDT